MSEIANKSGTVTTGGTQQTAIALNTSRRGFSVQNVSTADLWINLFGSASTTQPSIKLVSGALYETPPGAAPNGVVSIYGATTGQAFTAMEW